MVLAISANSAAAARAFSRSPAASRISTAAASILARAGANARVEQNTADRRGRGVDLALRETKQRQAWLWLSSALVRARVRRFGLRELAPQSMDLTDAVERRTRRGPGRQQLTRILRVLCGIIPFPAQLHDFGAIEQALTAVAHQVGLRGTPFRERHRPLVGAAQIEGLLAGLEDDAIDVAREDWRHVAGNHRDHRFVEQRNTLRDVSQSNQRAPAPGARQRRQIAIAKPAGDLGRLRECGVACRGIALHNALDGGRNQQIPAHDAVEVRLVEDALGSGEPSRRWRDGAALQQSERQPGCGSSGPFAVASIEACLMRARPEGLALGIASHEVGCRRKSFEVFGFQGCFTVGRFEQAIRFRPRLSLECVPGSPERLDVCHVASLRNGRSPDSTSYRCFGLSAA